MASREKPKNFKGWYDTEYLVYVGNQLCLSIDQDTFNKVNEVGMMLQHKFPDAKDPFLRIGDGCMKHKACPRHDNNHRGDKNFDINYFTTEPYDPDKQKWGNSTHYRLKGQGLTDIWLHNEHNNMVLNDKFDWERTFWFLTFMVQKFPESRFELHEKIWDKIQGNTRFSEWVPLVSHITLSQGHMFNHYKHIHVYTKYQY